MSVPRNAVVSIELGADVQNLGDDGLEAFFDDLLSAAPIGIVRP